MDRGSPPILLTRRYLKVIWELSEDADALRASISQLPPLPFDASAIPLKCPLPGNLQLWIVDL